VTATLDVDIADSVSILLLPSYSSSTVCCLRGNRHPSLSDMSQSLPSSQLNIPSCSLLPESELSSSIAISYKVEVESGMSSRVEPQNQSIPYPIHCSMPYHPSKKTYLDNTSELDGGLRSRFLHRSASHSTSLVYGVATYHDDWVLSREWLMAKCPGLLMHDTPQWL
jgi:hypothetical protein